MTDLRLRRGERGSAVRSLFVAVDLERRLIAVRKSSQVFGAATLTFVRPANRTVLAYVRQLGDDAIRCVANMSRAAQASSST